MDTLPPGRVVLFAGTGKNTQWLARTFVETLLMQRNDVYIRWIVPPNATISDAEKDALKYDAAILAGLPCHLKFSFHIEP